MCLGPINQYESYTKPLHYDLYDTIPLYNTEDMSTLYINTLDWTSSNGDLFMEIGIVPGNALHQLLCKIIARGIVCPASFFASMEKLFVDDEALLHRLNEHPLSGIVLCQLQRITTAFLEDDMEAGILLEVYFNNNVLLIVRTG